MVPFKLTAKQLENEHKKLEMIERLIKSLRLPESFDQLSMVVTPHMLNSQAVDATRKLQQLRYQYVKSARRGTIFYVCNANDKFSAMYYGRQLMKKWTSVNRACFGVEGVSRESKLKPEELYSLDVMKADDLTHDDKHKIAMARMRLLTVGEQ